MKGGWTHVLSRSRRTDRLSSALSCLLTVFAIGSALGIAALSVAGPARAAAAPRDIWAGMAVPVFEHPMRQERNISGAAIAQTTDGVMWFGTTAGLVRFDGYRAQVYDVTAVESGDGGAPARGPAPDAEVNALLAENGGGLLIGTMAAGLLRFDPQHDALAPLPCPAAGAEGRITALAAARDGGAWVGGAGGLDHIALPAGTVTHQKALPPPASSRLFAVLEDGWGGLWVGGHPGLYHRRPGESDFHRLMPPPEGRGDAAAVLDDDITSLYEDTTHRIWAGGRHGGFIRLDETDEKPQPYAGAAAARALTGANAVNGFLQPTPRRAADLLWIATGGGGIVTLNIRTGEAHRLFHDPARSTSLSSDMVRQIFPGHSGNIWAVTDNGLNRFDAVANGVMTVQAATPLSPGLSDSSVLSILVDRRQRVWLGLPHGRIDLLDTATGAITPLTLAGDAGTHDVTALAEMDDGAILAGSSGLSRIDARTLSVQPILPVFDGMSIATLAVHAGRVYIGTYDGVRVYDPLSGQVRHPSGTSELQVFSFGFTTDGGVLVGGRQGLDVLRTDAVQEDAAREAGVLRPLPVRSIVNLRDGAAATAREHRLSVTDMVAAPSGAVLVGTLGGEVGMVAGGDGVPVVAYPAISLSRRGQDKDRGIMSLEFDRGGRLWGAANDAIILADGGLEHFTFIGRREGGVAGGYNRAAAALGPGGELLFGGQKGLTIVHPDRLSSPSTRAPLAVTGMAINHVTRLGLIPRPGGWLVMQPSWRTLRLDFALLDYRYPADLHYAYRLEGFDLGWVPCPELPQASYTNLPPGDYVFRVRAWEETTDDPLAELAFHVVVAPYWYETAWFRILAVFSTIAALALVIAWRAEAFRRHQRELARMILERTRDLNDANRKLVRLAGTDSLTGILNRRRFFELAEGELARSARYGRPFSVILLDVDHFKAINDTYGHVVGDDVLRHVVGITDDMSRMMDLTARYGGEEVIILLPETQAAGALTVAERIREKLATTPIEAGGHMITVTASLGVAQWAGPPESLALLITRADEALYSAKHLGRNRTVLAASSPCPDAETDEEDPRFPPDSASD